MRNISTIFATVVAAVFVVTSWSSADAQRRSYYGGALNVQRLERRIEELERRVLALESSRYKQKREPVVMSDAMTVESAEKELAAAKQRLEFSEKLFGKGYIGESEMEAHKYQAARCAKLLQITLATRDGEPAKEITAELQKMDAEYNLYTAKRQLLLAERLTSKGVAGTNLEAHRQAVDEAQQRFDQVNAPPTDL